MLLEKAQQCNTECYLVLRESLADVIRWDKHVVSGLYEVSQNKVISHRDLDPKNVMWENDEPYIIDWEATGYVNPFQELIEVLNYWISDETGKYNKAKFDAMIQAYTESINISNVSWDAVLECSFDGMQQTKGTVYELRKYENQMEQLKDWINEYVSKKYTI